MNQDELAQTAYNYIEKDRHDNAIPYIAEIVTRFPDNTDIAKYKMLLAELQFKEKNFEEAQQVFENFSQFYPSDQRAEYAKYKTVQSAFRQVLPADCDQSNTEETLRLAQDYLANANFKEYRSDIEAIVKSCNEHLIEKEIYVFDFYLSKKEFDAARNRLKHLRQKFVALEKSIEPRILYLEYKLATKEKKVAEAEEHVKKLITQYPESQFAVLAQTQNNKQPFVF